MFSLGLQGCLDCLWTRQDDLRCKRVATNCGSEFGFHWGLTGEVDCGVMDMMLSQ